MGASIKEFVQSISDDTLISAVLDITIWMDSGVCPHPDSPFEQLVKDLAADYGSLDEAREVLKKLLLLEYAKRDVVDELNAGIM